MQRYRYRGRNLRNYPNTEQGESETVFVLPTYSTRIHIGIADSASDLACNYECRNHEPCLASGFRSWERDTLIRHEYSPSTRQDDHSLIVREQGPLDMPSGGTCFSLCNWCEEGKAMYGIFADRIQIPVTRATNGPPHIL